MARRPSQVVLLAQVPKVDDLIAGSYPDTAKGSGAVTMTLREKIVSQRKTEKADRSGLPVKLFQYSGPTPPQAAPNQFEVVVQGSSSSGGPSKAQTPLRASNIPIATRGPFGCSTEQNFGVIQGYSLIN